MFEWVAPVSVIVGSPLLMLYGLEKFPLLDGNDAVFIGAAGAGFVAAFVYTALIRRRAFPWGEQFPAFMWGAVFGFAMCGAMATLGTGLLLNGVLDRDDPERMDFSVARRHVFDGEFTLELSGVRGLGSFRPAIEVTREEYGVTRVGTPVVIDVKPGFFGRPWVSGYTVRDDQRSASSAGQFESDLEFLRQFTDTIVLAAPSGTGRVAVAPEYQGRVMTSTTGGPDAPSFGWIGRAAVAARQRQPHINVFGGEDRFWLGPEGGQYSLYFKAGDPFDLDHWQVPEPLDWGAWGVVSQSASTVRFRKATTLVNYSNTRLPLDVDRTIRVLSEADVASLLGQSPGADVRMVAFESTNTVTNLGNDRWRPESGLVSIWILGMFNPSPTTTIAIPFVSGPESTLGPIVNDTYFGKVPADRLRVNGPVILFRGDGQYRSKIGLSPSRALSVAGSYDAAGRSLTVVQYTRPPEAKAYVNSMWEIQREPYKGDVINSYNDGPPEPGKPPLGPFYELETSSPALSLSPGERYTHVHRTFHLVGPESELDRIARAVLKVSLAEIAGAFK